MRAIRQLGCIWAATFVVAITLGCRSGSESGVARTVTTDPTTSIAAQATVNPEYYNGGPQALPMRADKSYASDVVSIAKKDPLVTHKPPTPLAQQGPRATQPF